MHFLENIIENKCDFRTDVRIQAYTEQRRWGVPKKKAGRIWQLLREWGDILTSQSSFVLTVLTSRGVREECLCVPITHVKVKVAKAAEWCKAEATECKVKRCLLVYERELMIVSKERIATDWCRVAWTAPPEVSAPEVIITSAHSKRGARTSVDEDLLFESFINLPFSCRLPSFRPLSRTDYAAMQKWQTECRHYKRNKGTRLALQGGKCQEIKADWTHSERGLLQVMFQSY